MYGREGGGESGGGDWKGGRLERRGMGGREGRSVSQSVVQSVSRDDEDRRGERESD